MSIIRLDPFQTIVARRCPPESQWKYLQFNPVLQADNWQELIDPYCAPAGGGDSPPCDPVTVPYSCTAVIGYRNFGPSLSTKTPEFIARTADFSSSALVAVELDEVVELNNRFYITPPVDSTFNEIIHRSACGSSLAWRNLETVREFLGDPEEFLNRTWYPQSTSRFEAERFNGDEVSVRIDPGCGSQINCPTGTVSYATALYHTSPPESVQTVIAGAISFNSLSVKIINSGEFDGAWVPKWFSPNGRRVPIMLWVRA